ncbi:MAG: hypothetical protein LKJ45_00715 [Oscillospiraceae bacterium]|jgi:hypothetical protein|nr:hypothetical protein [Oscillospiraceae bacterium]
MKKSAKKALCLVCCAFLCLPLFCSKAFAANSGSSGEPTKLPLSEQIKNNAARSLGNTENGMIVITDKKQIAEIAKQQNLNDPKSITKITYDFRSSGNIQEGQQKRNKAAANAHYKTVAYNVKDLDTGYSYWDDYDSSIYDGPASISETCKRTSDCPYTASIDVDSRIVEAAVGFTFAAGLKGLDVKDKYSFTVPANSQIELRVFTNYDKKSFDIGHDHGGLLYPRGSGEAFKPVGLIFQQIQR